MCVTRITPERHLCDIFQFICNLCNSRFDVCIWYLSHILVSTHLKVYCTKCSDGTFWYQPASLYSRHKITWCAILFQPLTCLSIPTHGDLMPLHTFCGANRIKPVMASESHPLNGGLSNLAHVTFLRWLETYNAQLLRQILLITALDVSIWLPGQHHLVSMTSLNQGL